MKSQRLEMPPIPMGQICGSWSSYFFPAFTASLPVLVGRDEVQRANGLVTATNSALMTAGRAIAAGLAVVPLRAFGSEEDTEWFRLSVGAVSPSEIERVMPRLRAALVACE